MSGSITHDVMRHILGLTSLKWKMNTMDIPQDCFGVFTTIRRHQKLKRWPEDVHWRYRDWETVI